MITTFYLLLTTYYLRPSVKSARRSHARTGGWRCSNGAARPPTPVLADVHRLRRFQRAAHFSCGGGDRKLWHRRSGGELVESPAAAGHDAATLRDEIDAAPRTTIQLSTALTMVLLRHWRSGAGECFMGRKCMFDVVRPANSVPP